MRRYLASRVLLLVAGITVASAIPMHSGYAAGGPTITYLPSPHLLYPINVILQNPNPPVFHWTGVPNAVSYTLQVATDPTFNATVGSASTSNTRYTPLTTLASGVYYWRLRAQGAGNDLSLYVNGAFSVNWRGAPQPMYPAKGQTLQWGKDSFAFRWSAQPFATTYHLQLSTSPTFLSIAFEDKTPNLALVIPGSTLRNGVVYYWRVQGLDAAGHAGYYSIPQTFVKQWHPTPPLALPNSVVGDPTAKVFDPVLSWGRIDGAVKYQVQISTDILYFTGNAGDAPSPNSVVDDETTSLPYLVPKLGGLIDGNYIWHVRGIDDQGNAGPWSYWKPGAPGPYRFQVTPPAAVQPAGPVNGATITIPRLTWKAVPFASTYEVQLSTDVDFSKANTTDLSTYTNELAPPVWSPAPAFNVRYYWRVRAVNGSGLLGKWSTQTTGDPWSFIFSSGGPVAAIEPVNGATTTMPVLRWTRLANADHYEVDIHDGVTNNFTTAITQNTSYTPSDATLLNDCASSGCYWYVRGVMSDNNREPSPDQETYGSWFGANLGSLPLYRLPVPVRPLPGDPASPEMPSFCWQSTQGAAKYQLFYSSAASTFQPMVTDNSAQTAGTCQTPPTNLPDGTYQWFVRAIDQSNGILSDGPISEFSINSGLLSTGSSATCSLLASDYLGPQERKVNIYQPEISWNSVPCAHGYHMYVATDPFFNNIVDEQVNYPYTVYLPAKAPYFPTYATLYVLIRPILGHQADGTPIELPPGARGAFAGRRIVLNAPRAQLQFPGPGAVVSETPLLHWNRYNQGSSYEVQIGNVPDFSATPAVDANTFSSSFVPPGELPDGVYYWHIRAINAAGQKFPWSETWKFIKRSQAPVLYSPANNAILNAAPVFSWQQLQRAAQYEIQISNNDPTFANALLDSAKVNLGAYAPKIIYPPISRFAWLYWRVRVIDAAGNTGPWSHGYRFHMAFRYPIELTPLRNATLTTLYPVVAWKLLPGAASYTLEFSPTAEFTTITQTISTQGTAWTPLSPLSPGDYYWRLHPVDGSGGVGLPSVYRIFTVPTPKPTATPAPSGNATAPTPTPTPHA